MKFLIFSDLQANNHKLFSKIDENGFNSRLLDAISIIDQIATISVAHRVDSIFFLGDLFHTRRYVEVSIVAQVYSAITALAAKIEPNPIFLIAGNHDLPFRNADVSILSIFRDSKFNIHVVQDPKEVTICGEQISLCPWIDDIERRRRVLNSFKYHNLLMIHSGFLEAKLGLSDKIIFNELSVEEVKPWNAVFAGHFHMRQVIKNVMIPGSPLQVDMGERNDPPKGCLLLESDGKHGITLV